MSGMKRNVALALAVAAAVAAPGAFATNGYFTEGEGTVNRGMAGAGIAMPQDALAAAVNPAGLVKLGGRMDIALGVFRPDRKYEISGNDCSFLYSGCTLNGSGNGNDDGNFWIPSFGYNMKLSSTDAFNISVYGNGGMNTNYSNAVFGAFGSTGNTGVDLSQLFVNGAYAHSFGALSVGGSAIFAYQRFKAYGLQAFDAPANPFASTSPGNVSNNGYDTTNGFGVRLGVLYDINKDVSVGATYQSKIKGQFDKYRGLFAEQGEFDIPSTYGVGIAWKASPVVDVAFDWVKIKYTDSKSVSNSFANILNCPAFGGTDQSSCLGGDNGAGFGWTDINVYKLGVQYKASGGWTWRGGWNHGDNPIPSSQAVINILAPGVVQDHLNFGFTKAMDKNSDVNFMFMHAFEKKVSGDIPAAFGGGTAEIQMQENYAEIGYSKKF
ncbi:MAG TPA: outer membrane protein transport protein [Candidatus Methylomirabilis sp.]|nr:outer membrane protein transport protein [Candidatus Methylomirabilis sp.]